MLSQFYQYLPNILSLFRLFMVPILLYLAFNQQANAFILILMMTVLTDVMDGYLARRFGVVSELGAQLDSWGDFFIYVTMVFSAWLLWPEVVVREQVYAIIIIGSITLPIIVGLIKFKIWTSYHTWSAKVAVLISIIAYVLLFTGISDWPFRAAAFFCLYAAIEQTLITLICYDKRMVDVKSIWHALKEKKAKKDGVQA